MKKRILSFLLSACMLITMLPTTVFADEAATNVLPDALDLTEGNITIENGTDEGTLKVTYGAAMVVDNIEPSAIINITQTDVATATTNKIEIAADVTDGVNIKLSGVNIKPSGGAALAINAGAGKVNLILADNSGNKLTGANNYAGLQKNNSAREADGLLTISCESASLSGHTCNDNCGKLTANAGDYGAGIGGGKQGAGSHISIYGGDITAKGGTFGGAGIGGGSSGTGSHINIYGGNITATGSNSGAGIGGGSYGEGSNINIYGGSIIASGTQGAGIGGGDGGNGNNINIYDGNINATGSWLSSGIGGGDEGNGSHISIYGGNIEATGGTGIGGGSQGAGNNINISGGIVTAVGQSSGTGIGGGYKMDGSNITISGGIVSATGGNNGGAAIGGGGGYYNSNIGNVAGGKGINITISGGTVTAKSTTTAYDIGGGSMNYPKGDSSIIITGGNIYASTIGRTPKNGSGIDVYKATFSIPDDTTGGTNLAALSFTSNDTSYSYTMNDTISILDGGAGKLFVYLPVGTYSTEYSGKIYTAKVDTSGNSEFKRALIGTVTITGTLKYSQTLTAVATIIGGPAGVLTYQWKRDDVNIGTGTTYTTTEDDIGHILTCVVTDSELVGFISGSTEQAIGKMDQAPLSIDPVTGKKYGDEAFDLSTTGGSGTGEVSYSVPENNGVLTLSGNQVTIVGAGTVTVTATKGEDDLYSSISATYDITIDPPPAPPAPPSSSSNTPSPLKSSTDNPTGITAEGTLYNHITVNHLVEGETGDTGEVVDPQTYNELKVSVDKGYSIIGAYEVKCSSYTGSLTLTFPVDAKYNGRDFVVTHRTSAGNLLTYTGTVKEGKIVITVSQLSPFMIAIRTLPEMPDIESWINPFVDVNKNDWFFKSIALAYEYGLLQGTSATTFEPHTLTTRSMFVTMLYNMVGKPDIITEETSWYAKGRAWAMENGISDGTAMDSAITREQLITMLWRYAGEPDVIGYEGLTGFVDVDQISGYAKQACAWAHKEGIIAGKGNGILDPKGYATRAETATVMINYLNTTVK